MTTYIPIEPLTFTGFSPFGEVIEFRGKIINNNQGRCEKYPALASVQCGGAQSINTHLFYQSEPIVLPFNLQVLEQHPVGCQMFMPLNHEPYLVVVAEGGDLPDLASLRCFRAERGQGVVYSPGTWHHPLLSLSARSEFLVADPADVGDNLNEVFLDKKEFCIGRMH